jgi:hypothetical protein
MSNVLDSTHVNNKKGKNYGCHLSRRLSLSYWIRNSASCPIRFSFGSNANFGALAALSDGGNSLLLQIPS